ncbi:deoxyribose-phosphate aldolase [Cylindrobasidium torrendii FP15055 ss-10]|uniref:deoxyribose-phosphate aldolase n=1 Tax=Cylindrobasidium torrendii FP15055 ss-10 TaxID=1314674 RepID=A0A0D7AYK2_9AGAR|nr:deoxyribose-phosphate aldolase [Cylindrobasidium torrendii FP15055 ss-10]
MSRSNEEWSLAVASKVASVLAEPAPAPAVAPTDLAPFIDHTLLKPDATVADVDKLCDEAIEYKFKSCCINGANVAQVARRLKESPVAVCAVIGFPLGASATSVKAFETTQCVQDGATEIDMVINVGALRSKNYALVHSDIAACATQTRAAGAKLKVILETVFLTEEEIIAGSYIAAEAQADFVKTCTGFQGGGASTRHVQLMKQAVAYKGGAVLVKASAGIRSLEKCVEMIQAGADRIGTSSGVAIMEGKKVAEGSY